MIKNDKRGYDVYTVEEIAGTLRVHPITIFRALKKGKIKGIKIGNVWRISEEELERIMKEGI